MRNICKAWATAFSLAIFPSHSLAQLELVNWTNFEDGKLPAGSITVGSNPAATHEVVKLGGIGSSLPAFYDAAAAYELGDYALKIRVAPPETSIMNGLITGIPMSRDTLGEDGFVLFQADVYLPDSKQLPNVAVMACEPPPDDVKDAGTQPSVGTSFYRFGITLNEVPYYSYVKPGAPKPILFLQDRDLLPHVPRPGWRRLSLMLTKNELRAYMDGRGTVFSPHPQKDLRTMMPGVLLTESKIAYDCYIDNITVHVSKTAQRLPASPYDNGWVIPPGEAARQGVQPPHSGAMRDMRWMNPLAAWQAAQQKQQPMLLYFCSPGTARCEALEKLFALTESNQYLSGYATGRVDVNQAKGSKIAQDYQVFKVPTLLVISPDAKTAKRVTPTPQDNLKTIFDGLKL